MMKKKAFYISIPVLIACIIFYLCCLIPPNDIPNISSAIPIDKVVHFLMYVGFAGACFFSYIHLYPGKIKFTYLFLICILQPILFGGLIEIIQLKYCPGRSGDWFDFLADSLGVIFVVPFAYIYKKYVDKKTFSK